MLAKNQRELAAHKDATFPKLVSIRGKISGDFIRAGLCYSAVHSQAIVLKPFGQ